MRKLREGVAGSEDPAVTSDLRDSRFDDISAERNERCDRYSPATQEGLMVDLRSLAARCPEYSTR
jgi:hypothetical protein